MLQSASEGSEGSEEAHTEYLNHHKQTVGRNTDVKGAASIKGSEGNEECVISRWRRDFFIQ